MNDVYLAKNNLSEFYHIYADKMRKTCIKYLKDPDTVEDVLQDGFVKAFNKIDQYNGNSSFEGWLRRIFRNTTLDHLRRGKRSVYSDDMDIIPAPFNNDDIYFTPGGELSEVDLIEDEILCAINQLPTGRRKIMNLYIVRDATHKEIAEELGIKVCTSKSQLCRGRKIVQDTLIKMSTKKKKNGKIHRLQRSPVLV